jgi:hypothetical protein
VELEYPDGGVPTDAILLQFLRLCDRELAAGGVVAAHCAAGLGRTGTHMAAWLMHAHGFTAREATAWCRICRPGSVVGVQQHFLAVKERQLVLPAEEEEVVAVKARVKARRRPDTMGSRADGLRPVADPKARRHPRTQARHVSW